MREVRGVTAHSYHRDSQMRVDGNMGGAISYDPNSYKGWQEQPDFRGPPLTLEGAADHWNHRVDDELLFATRQPLPAVD
jgi:catalase